MQKYILRRFLQTIPVLIGVTLLTYMTIWLAPGDPIQSMLGVRATPEQIAQVKADLGLDKPLILQYFTWLKNILQGNFGRSLQNNRKVLDMILERIPATLELGLASFIIALILGVSTGIISAVKRNTWVDYLCRFFALLGVSMPVFWQGLILIIAFSLYIPIFPTSGRGLDPWSLDGLMHLILPAVTLGTSTTASLNRLTRSSMLEVLREDYITTARAKGLRERVVVYKHALRNALIPVVTILGFRIGAILGGSVVTETVFAWPGIGRLAIKAVIARDFPVVLGDVVLIAMMYVYANAIVDIMYAVIDPRISYN